MWPRPKPPSLLPLPCQDCGWQLWMRWYLCWPGVFRVTVCPCKGQTTHPRNAQPGKQLMYVFSSLKPQHLWQVVSGTHALVQGPLDAGQGSVPAARALPAPRVPEGLLTLMQPWALERKGELKRLGSHAARPCLMPVPLCLGVWCSLSFLQIEPVLLQATVCSVI